MWRQEGVSHATVMMKVDVASGEARRRSCSRSRLEHDRDEVLLLSYRST